MASCLVVVGGAVVVGTAEVVVAGGAVVAGAVAVTVTAGWVTVTVTGGELTVTDAWGRVAVTTEVTVVVVVVPEEQAGRAANMTATSRLRRKNLLRFKRPPSYALPSEAYYYIGGVMVSVTLLLS